MPEPTDPPKGDPPSGVPAPPAKDDSSGTFTQEDLNRIATREKEEGKRAAVNELAEQFGMSIEDATTLIKTAKEQQDAAKSEAQRAKEEADRKAAEAEADKASAAEERHKAKIERALLRAGMRIESADDEKVFSRAVRALGLEVGADDEMIKSEIKNLKAEIPSMFGPASNGSGKGPRGGAPSGTPPGSPPKPSVGDDAFQRGQERAKSATGGAPEFAIRSIGG